MDGLVVVLEWTILGDVSTIDAQVQMLLPSAERMSLGCLGRLESRSRKSRLLLTVFGGGVGLSFCGGETMESCMWLGFFSGETWI